MSELRQAVEAEIGAYTPAGAPAFSALAERKRARDRRRLVAVGAAALSAVAVVAAAAIAPSPGGGPDRLAEPAATPAQGSGDVLAALVQRCLEDVTATPVPGLVGMTEQEAFPPNARSAVRVLARDGACAVDSAVDSAAGMTDVVLSDGRIVWAGRRSDVPAARAAVRPAPADGVYSEARATGVLRADPVTGCLWLERPDGTAAVQLLLQGQSYRVDVAAPPVAVRDGGTVVARVGERVEVGGGLDGAEVGVAGCPVSAPVFLGRLSAG